MDHSQHNHHKPHHDHGSHGIWHGSAQTFLRRFWIVTFLLIPLVFANEMVMHALGLQEYTLSKWIGFGIATIIFGFALIFFQHALHEIRARKYGMMTLISLAVGAGYLYSVAARFVPSLYADFYCLGIILKQNQERRPVMHFKKWQNFCRNEHISWLMEPCKMWIYVNLERMTKYS